MKDKKLLTLLLLEEEESSKEEIQIIPTIDVMMFLLVFFILYTLNVIPLFQQRIEIPTTKTAQEQRENKEILRIYITKEGEVLLENKIKGLEALRNYVRENKSQIKGVLMIVDKDAKMEKVLSVMDTLKLEGVSSIGIASNKEER